jgi:hypothetical protein
VATHLIHGLSLPTIIITSESANGMPRATRSRNHRHDISTTASIGHRN